MSIPHHLNDSDLGKLQVLIDADNVRAVGCGAVNTVNRINCERCGSYLHRILRANQTRTIRQK